MKARLEIPEEMEALIGEELESFTGLVSFEKSMPGLTDIYQIIPAKGGRSPETQRMCGSGSPKRCPIGTGLYCLGITSK